MSFPQTRHTLIQRIVKDGSDADWRQFLQDYWGAVCRFAQRAGRLSAADAEDVASQTFDAILQAQLLNRWTQSRTAKLRTLICAVVRKILSNRFRVERGRVELTKEHAEELERYVQFNDESPDRREDDDLFYVAWVEELVHRAVEQLLDEYNGTGRGDYFRVLHGRICEELSFAEIAEGLELAPSAVDNYYRHVRRRLSEVLQELVLAHARRYCEPADSDDEFQREWRELFDHLDRHGGLEAAIRDISLRSSSVD